jgi:Uma2 family endonuclease
MIPPLPATKFETDKAGRILYPVDNGEPLSNDTEHLRWITFVKNGLEDWFGDRTDVFVAADLLWYPIEGRPDISKAPDVMVVMDHRAGDRPSYKQWEESGRPPNVVFEFISKSNTADEMMEKLEFYSEMGCDEFFVYDYRRGRLSAFCRGDGPGLRQQFAEPDGAWKSKVLGMCFGLDKDGRLWVRRPDGKLMENQREIARRAEAEALRAEAESKRAETEAKRAEAEALRAEAESKRAETEAKRAETESKRAEKLAAKLREMGIDPDGI